MHASMKNARKVERREHMSSLSFVVVRRLLE